MSHVTRCIAVLTFVSLSAGPVWSQEPGPVGPSPYEAVDGWLKPFDQGFTFGGNVGVQPDTPNRIFILQRGSTRLPNPVPAGYDGYPASIGLSTIKGQNRVYRNVIFVVDGNGKMIETWSQWDSLFARTDQEVGEGFVKGEGDGHSENVLNDVAGVEGKVGKDSLAIDERARVVPWAHDYTLSTTRRASRASSISNRAANDRARLERAGP